MANLIAKYPSRSSFTTRIPHLEGQEVFGSTKRRVDITVRSENNSHRHDYVNFSQPRVNATSSGFNGSNVDASESSGIIRDEAFVLTFQGLKVEECVCRDGVWRIERCPPSLNTHYFAIQRGLIKHCDDIIIAKKTIRAIPSPCYNGLWFDLKGSVPICHKLWFCEDDLTYCVEGIGKKYCVDRPLVPSMWPMQVGTNLTQFEATILEEVKFVLCEACKIVLFEPFL
jgi:hypothetical protein